MSELDKPVPPSEVDSCVDIRQGLIELRAECFKQWPEAIPETVLLSHAIAWLDYCIKLHNWSTHVLQP